MNIFIFNRGLRLYDNTTLIHQTKQMGAITPIFIFTSEQIDKNKNKYYSNNSVQFMIESLKELATDISDRGGKLYFFKGDNSIDVIESIAKHNKIASIGMNFDYTPYARQRSELIQKFCTKNKITFFEKEDYLLHPILEGETKKANNTPYLVFTPFKRFCMSNLKVAPVDRFNQFKFAKIKENKHLISEREISRFYEDNKDINIHGGRKNGLHILKNLKNFSNYQKERDMLTYNTTFLSAHNHYMTISIREEYWAIIKILGKKSGIISELYWRDFYTNVVYYFPNVLRGQLHQKAKSSTDIVCAGKNNEICNASFKKKFDKIKLPPFNKKWFVAWCEGITGFPIVDAAMRQLNTTGFMHNRCRMITMSFLIKFMHIDWRYGEQYFATKLIDYDAMMNNSGAQWCASSGTDAQPYFRFFNPWIQQKTYDPKCLYIKKYVAELRDVEPKLIHKWDTLFNKKLTKNDALFDKKLTKNDALFDKNINYPPPILDHSIERKITLKLYKKHL